MAELRSIDPNTLAPNPNDPRRTPTPKAMDDQLLASIQAIGLIQPPRVKEVDGALVVIAGNRRVKAAIAAELAVIDVLVCDADESADAMRSISENLIRASMTSVDIWRATEALEARGWNEQAIADALALPVRTIKRLKLLAHLHPAMLDVMAGGSMPNEDQLRSIAAATREEQAQVWKKHKPKKGQDVTWYEIARALSKRRIPFAAAKFDEDLARAYGVTWQDDLFAPAGEDGRYTTDVEGFFGAQQEWLQNHLPERGTMLPTGEYGQPALPKKAERVYGKPGRGDLTGHYLDGQSGDVRTIVYRLPEAKKPAGRKGASASASKPDDTPAARVRPDVTQKGHAMIGDMRTDALHQALQQNGIDDQTMIALLVLALSGKNVSVQSGASLDRSDRDDIAASLTEGGVLTTDAALVHMAGRRMLTAALSCRENMSNSGHIGRIAGDAISASSFLPTMATEEFLSCVAKPALERAATAEGVRVEVRGKDTRARLIERFRTGTYVYPAAQFRLSAEDVAAAKAARQQRYVPGAGRSATSDDIDDGLDDLGREGEDLPDDVDPAILIDPSEAAAFAEAAD